MDHIETAILNCYGIREAEQNMVFAARLTQHGHSNNIHSKLLKCCNILCNRRSMCRYPVFIIQYID